MELHYRSYGAGPPLLVLHGLFGSLDNWATLARRWGAMFHVWTLDARNHGRSFHDERMDYPSMAEDVARFMERHGLPSAHLLGHSMGGKTAMQFALTHPGSVRRLVVVDIAPRVYGRRHDALLDALLHIDPRRLAGRGEADAALAAAVADARVRQFLLKNLARAEEGGYRWKLNLAAIARDYDALRAGPPAGARCERPALFIRGGRSSYVRDEDRARIRGIFPRATVVTIRRAGHWVHAEAPEELFTAVTTFLRAE